MITNAVVSAILACLDAVVSLLPSWSMNLQNDTTLWHQFERINGVFPVVTLARQLAIFIGLVLALKLWDLGVWVYHQFWGGA